MSAGKDIELRSQDTDGDDADKRVDRAGSTPSTVFDVSFRDATAPAHTHFPQFELTYTLAIHQFPLHNQFRLYSTGGMGDGRSHVPICLAQWWAGVIGVWRNSGRYWFDSHCNVIG